MKNLTLKPLLEGIIFGSKWLLAPFYLGLIMALGIYLWVDAKAVFTMLLEARELTIESAMMALLELVDMAMIAALVKTIISGGYTSFVDKNTKYNADNVSSGTLKVKMSTSLVGVSSIHLLQKFIDAKDLPWDQLGKLLAIHGAFLGGSLILAWIEIIHVRGEKIEHEIKHTDSPQTSLTHAH